LNSLLKIIELLSEIEKKEFIKFLQKKNKTSVEKNIELFILLTKQLSQTTIIETLYGNLNKNAFHALCKRLQDSLIEFIAIKGFENENSAEQEIFKKLLAARILLDHQLYHISYKLLFKIEEKATILELPTILHEIYLTQLHFAHLYSKIDLKDIQKKIKVNHTVLEKEMQLSLFFADLQNKIKTDNFNNASIEELLHSQDLHIEDSLTFKSLYQLFLILDLKGQLATNYHSTIPVLEKLYALVNKKQHLHNRHLYYHLEILQLLSYAHFRSRNFITFKSHLDEFEKLLEEHPLFLNQFKEELLLFKVYFLNFTGKATAAIELLQTNNSFLPQLFLTTCYVQQNEIKTAYQTFLSLNKTDAWYSNHFGEIWVVKKKVIELILLIELDNFDVFNSRLIAFQKKYSKTLLLKENKKVSLFIKLITKFYLSTGKQDRLQVKEELKQLNDLVNYKEDIFLICFYAWLKSKLENKNLYRLTLDLVNIK